ncbi:MAG: Holliday junction branch migration protein RuvA [Saccharospirillum sp.]|nr:Holliday junction branch migration protein RuvA [Saccharospirillum sp.]
MIGRLVGILLDNKVPDVLLDVSGVGYEVSVPLSTGFRLPKIGEQAVLYTHLTIREDAHQLFGFHSREERSLFRSLIKTSGVGPKLALAILSGMEPDRFVQCIHNDDVALLVKIPGVGKKTAERLIIEMRDRLKDLSGAVDMLSSPQPQTPQPHSAEADAETALVALGYKPQQATKAIARVAQPDMTSEALIRAALKQMI